MAIIGFDTSLLVGYYQSRLPRDPSLAPPNPQTLAANTKPKDTTGVLPPWDSHNKQLTEQQRETAALSDKAFIDLSNADLSGLASQGTAAADNKRLYALYQAVNRLSTLASMASEKDRAAGTLAGLDRRFQSGLAEVYDFLGTTVFDNLSVIPGVKTDRVTTTVAIPSPTTTYTGGVAIKGDVFQAVPGLTGNETITLSVASGGATTGVAVDLSAISGPLTLDAIATAFNAALEGAGFATRFHRTEIGTAAPDADKSFGLEIDLSHNEQISLSASDAEPALYFAGTSGSAATQSAKLAKLTGLDDPALVSVFSRDIVPDAVATADAGTTVSGGTATARATVVDGDGNVYVVGDTTGSFGNQINQGQTDVFLRKYDSAGNVLWTRLLGSSESANGYALALDPTGGVVVAGRVTGKLSAGAVGGGDDGFVAKYAADGSETFARQIAPVANDEIRAVTVADDGSIYLSGKVAGTIAAGQTNAGGTDAFVTRLDATGALAWHRQFGTAGSDTASGVALASDGGILVASQEDGHAVVRKFGSANGSDPALWQVDLGDLAGGALGGIAVKDGAVYVSGATGNANLTAGGAASIVNAAAGSSEAFVFRIDDAGASASANFVSYVGTAGAERAGTLSVTDDGVYLSGDTAGTFAGEHQSTAGATNAFVARLGTDGTLAWAHQFGGFGGQSSARAIAIDTSGASALDALGLPKTVTTQQSRDLLSQSTLRVGDYFTMTLTDAHGNTRERRITVEARDTFNSLADKINRVLLLDGKAEIAYGKAGRTLRIQVDDGVQVAFAPGKESFDALAGLGIGARVLVNDGDATASASADEDSKQKPVIGLDIARKPSLAATASAADAANAMQAVLAMIRTAYRTLNDEGINDLLGTDAAPKGKQGGTVPAYLTNQIASYQAALQRLSGGY